MTTKISSYQFHLIDHTRLNYKDWHEENSLSSGVKIEADVIKYMAHTLKWISTYIPVSDKRTQGFAADTETVIRVKSAPKALNIFRGWIALFEAGPVMLRLHIGYTYIPDEDGKNIYFEVSRDELIEKLEKLVILIQSVIESKGKLYILCVPHQN